MVPRAAAIRLLVISCVGVKNRAVHSPEINERWTIGTSSRGRRSLQVAWQWEVQRRYMANTTRRNTTQTAPIASASPLQISGKLDRAMPTNQRFANFSAYGSSSQVPDAIVEDFRDAILERRSRNPPSRIRTCESLLKKIPAMCAKEASVEECSICLHSVASEVRVKVIEACGHGFHADCLRHWLGRYEHAQFAVQMSFTPAKKMKNAKQTAN